MKRNVIFLLAAMLVFIIGAPFSEAGYMRGKHYTLDEIYNVIRGLEKKRPDLVTVEEIGASVEGRPILAVKIARRDGKVRPEALITSSIHAMEFMGDRVALSIAEKLIDRDGVDPWVTSLLDRVDFYFVPLLNPDGYYRASRRLNRGFTTRRTNAHSVDLNRNFPYAKNAKPKGIKAGSTHKIVSTYRGPHPLSEPESTALNNFVAKHKFFVAINFHTTGGFFIYPWSYKVGECPNKNVYDDMGKAFNDHQQKCKYKVQQANVWYQTVGSLNDWLYGRYGTLSVTVEVGKPDKRLINPIRFINPFYWYNPTKIDEWIDNDRDATLYAIEVAYDYNGGKPLQPMQIDWLMP